MRKNKRCLLIAILSLSALSSAFLFAACNGDTHEHAWGEWRVVTEAGCATDGLKERVCPGCGESETETIPAAGHTADDKYFHDETSHWRVCSVCGEKIDSASHSFGHDNICITCGFTISYSTGLSYALKADGKSYTVTGTGTFTGSDLIVPAFYKSLPVTGIEGSAFANSGVASVRLGENVSYVGPYAFAGCKNLIKADLGAGVTYIGDYAFDDSFALTRLTVGGDISYVGQHAFRDCFRLVEVNDYSSLNIEKGSIANGYMGYYALAVNTDADAESRLTEMEDFIFYHAEDGYKLVGYRGHDASLTLPANIEGKKYDIHAYAFKGCETLGSVALGEGVENVGKQAFADCVALTAISFDNALSVGASAFENCRQLTDVEMGGKVTEIGEYAFSGCESLTSVDIPSGVTAIGNYAFDGCAKLTAINCEHAAKPAGWAEYWYWYNAADAVHWGATIV